MSDWQCFLLGFGLGAWLVLEVQRWRRGRHEHREAMARIERIGQAPARASPPSCAYPFCEPPECCGKPPTSGGTET